MAIAKGKRRHQVTLTTANVERFQSLVKNVGLPSGTMSALCDDAIKGMSDILAEAKERGSLGMEDIFRLMGKQVELLMEEERRENETLQQKRNTLSDKPIHE